MPKIMILGGGNCQLSAAIRCRELGISTVLIDYTAQPPAAAYADCHEQISTFDATACIAAARRHRIDGVLTRGTDQPVYTASLPHRTAFCNAAQLRPSWQDCARPS